VQRLKSEGAIILGKANLSEWAYYFCNGCPLGYSAVGGQTMNAYGRMLHESGGSSSGSGAAIAANLAVAAVGSETSGSILSPSSLNSLVGLKPTVGLLSRSGIIPISSTLDTPGPMTKNVIDNAIMLESMMGYDANDNRSNATLENLNILKDLDKYNLKGKRFGVFKNLLKEVNYANMISILQNNGAIVVELENTSPKLDGFRSILSLDMKKDLPEYLKSYASANIEVSDVKEIMNYNLKNEFLRAPYGQELFEGIYKDTLSDANFEILKKNVNANAIKFFDDHFKPNSLDFVLSINNTHAAVAAVAFYPCLTLPMGYLDQNQPQGLTLIAPSWSEKSLLQAAYAIEKASKIRKMPKNYE
jgi:amidase